MGGARPGCAGAAVQAPGSPACPVCVYGNELWVGGPSPSCSGTGGYLSRNTRPGPRPRTVTPCQAKPRGLRFSPVLVGLTSSSGWVEGSRVGFQRRKRDPLISRFVGEGNLSQKPHLQRPVTPPDTAGQGPDPVPAESGRTLAVRPVQPLGEVSLPWGVWMSHAGPPELSDGVGNEHLRTCPPPQPGCSLETAGRVTR